MRSNFCVFKVFGLGKASVRIPKEWQKFLYNLMLYIFLKTYSHLILFEYFLLSIYKSKRTIEKLVIMSLFNFPWKTLLISLYYYLWRNVYMTKRYWLKTMYHVQWGTCKNGKDFIYKSYNINILKLFIEWLWGSLGQHR